MGSVIGAGIGAVGSIIGGQQSAKAAKQSAMIQAAAADRAGERALTGYKYLTEGEGAAPMKQYINAGTTALGHQGNTQSLMMDLLGITGYENSRNGAQTPATGGGGTPAAGGGAPAAGGSGNAFSHYMQPPGYDTPQGATPAGTFGLDNAGMPVDRNPPPFPTWYQQQSGQFAPGQAMPAQGQPAPQFQYGPGQNALNYYSVPNGGTVRPDGYGGVQFGGFAPGDPKFTPAAYSGA